MTANALGTCAGSGIGSFPNGDWDAAIKADYFGKGKQTVLFFGQEVSLAMPEHFVCGDECQAVLSLKSSRTPSRLMEIKDQAWEDHFIYAAVILPLKLGGVSSIELAAALRVAHATLQALKAPTYTLKAYFNRARPWNCCGTELDPVFKKMDPEYPGHPSYPSGHSTTAHTLAYLLSRPYPNLRGKLLGAAGRLAENREVAGLHYPSDSAAGRWLGEQFADAIVKAPPELQDSAWLKVQKDFEKLGKP